MAVAFVGKGIALVATTPAPVAVVTPEKLITFRLKTEAGDYILTEDSQYLVKD